MGKRKLYYQYATHSELSKDGREYTFDKIFKKGLWKEGQTESFSGPGSTLEQTREIVKKLPEILDELKIRSVTDAPCGDYNWMKLIDWTERKYVGLDLVAEIIEKNRSSYASEQVQFNIGDIMTSKLPDSDLLCCRDLLVHFSYQDIRKTLRNLLKSSNKYLMTTTFPQEPYNEDIETGDWRPIDLCKPPFSFPKPLLLLNEKCTEAEGLFTDKSLGVWNFSELRSISFIK